MMQAKGTILEAIVRDTRGVISARRAERSLSTLESMSGFARPPLSLAGALAEPVFSVIAEAKKASPSKGVIREDFDVVSITREYQDGGAAAVSILTEPLYFQGDITFLESCRPHIQIPILRKDFIVDTYQIHEARAFGADAVLLIAACLERSQIAELQDAAEEIGLSVLVELYAPSELDLVDVDRTDIIGVNSRDLHTFEVDMDRAIDVLNQLPQHVTRVAESGIESQKDGLHLRDNGIHAALIGEYFMREERPGKALASFLKGLA